MNVLRTMALCLAVTSVTALAQKPALVKDTEANGRMPYVHSLEWRCPFNFPTLCPSHINSFPVVPAGYRLVVTHVSVRFPSNPASVLHISALLSNGLTASDQDYTGMYLQTPVCTGPATGENLCVSSGPVSFYVEPTFTPTVVVQTGTSTSYPDEMRVTIVGYLISL